MNVKFPNNTSKWQMEFNSALKGLIGSSEKLIKPIWIVKFEAENGNKSRFWIIVIKAAKMRNTKL
jgi:hypothetical protein